ncbi:MAG: hypothetical protein OXD40_08515 [bacterium]|nr:hypothetical protein [bacterium]
MAGRPKGEKRRARCVMATDSEWQRIGERAAADGLSISDHVVRSLLVPLSWYAVQHRVARAVLVLERIEKMRFDEADMGTTWEEIDTEVKEWLDSQGLRG